MWTDSNRLILGIRTPASLASQVLDMSVLPFRAYVLGMSHHAAHTKTTLPHPSGARQRPADT